MKKLFVYLLIATFVVSMAFMGIGCKTVAETTTTVETTVTAETTATETTTATGEPKTIVYWSMWNENETQAAAIKQWVEDYKKVRPEITVEVSFIGREVLSKVVVARSAGEVLDIVEGDALYIMPTLGVADELLVLDEALSAPRYEGDKSWKENFATSGFLSDNNITFIPLQVFTEGFFYNKKLWRDNNWNVPKTWDDFLALCETIKTTSDIAPLTVDVGSASYTLWYFDSIVERINGNNQSTLKAAEDKTGKSWEDPTFKKAIEMERELIDKGYFIEGFEGFTWPEGQQAFGSGDAAMIFCGSWIPNELNAAVAKDWEWGFFTFPEISGGAGKSTEVPIGRIGFSVLKDTKVAPEVIDFLKFCTSVENAQKLAEGAQVLVCIPDVTQLEFLSAIGIAINNATGTYGFDSGVANVYPDYFSDVLTPNHSSAFVGTITPDQFVENMSEGTISYWESK